MARSYYVYMLISRSGNALYVGMTSNLRQRVEQHQRGLTGAHTTKYRIRKLIWFESHDCLETAHLREKRIKRWRRQWKIDLITAMNPTWRDLSLEL